MADHEHSPSGPVGCFHCAAERAMALRGKPDPSVPSACSWNVYRDGEFLWHAATPADALAMAHHLGGNEIQFGLDGDVMEVK
jgi:hypothetical protein